MVKFIDEPSLIDLNRTLERIEVGGLVYSGSLALYALLITKAQKSLNAHLTRQLIEQEDEPLLVNPHPPRLRSDVTSMFPPPPLPKRAASDTTGSKPLLPNKRNRADSEASARTVSSTITASSTGGGGGQDSKYYQIKRHVAFVLVLNETSSNEDYDFSDTPITSFEQRSAAQAYAEVKAFLESVLKVPGLVSLVDQIFEGLRSTINVWNAKQTTCLRYVPEGEDNPMAPSDGESLILFIYNPSNEYRRVILMQLTSRASYLLEDEAESQRSWNNNRSQSPEYQNNSPLADSRLLSTGGFRSATPASNATSLEEEEYFDGEEEESDQDV